jgi:CHAT domain-containing protein/tetratricopeptide (TPR) repeat protein
VSTALAEPTLAERAARMVDSGGAAPADVTGTNRLALAWVLKDLCYAAWSSEPQRAASAADAVRALCTGGATRASAHAREIEALADWTAGIAQVTRGRMAEATQSFDRAAETFRGLGHADHAAQTQVPKIMALSMQGQYAAAADCAESAQQAFVALGDVRAAGKVSLNLGALNQRRGEFAQAARDSRAASVLFARVGDHEHSVMADINMAAALTSMGDFDEALRIYARARMRAGTHGFPVLETLADELVAMLQLARGRYREALAGLEGARRRYEQLGMPQHVAIAEKALADAYLELRLLPEALSLFDQVSARFEVLNISDEQAWTLAQRGRALALLDQPVRAADSFARAAALFAAQGSRVGESAVMLARAELALVGGEATAAVALAGQAGRGFAAAGLADGQFRADVVRANALLHSGNIEQAGALFGTTLERACALQLLTVQVRCLTGQGLAAQALGQAGAAQRAFNAAVELFEDQRRALPGDELRSAFLTDHLRPYQELLRMALQAHAGAPSPAAAATVLLQLDRFRARSLGERLAQQAGPEEDASTPGLRERVNWLYRRVQRLDDEGESSAVLNDELRRTELELLERARRARIAAHAPRPNVVADEAFELSALQALLGEDGALLEYGVLDDELFACVVTRAGVQLHRHVARWSEVLDALRAARFQIDSLRHGAAQVQPHLQSLTERATLRMRRLCALVWAPLAGALAGSQRVLIVPHAQLGSLPFAALHDGQTYLAQQHQLAVVPSARLALRGLLRQPVHPRQALVLGESSRLPHAAHEAAFVSGLFAQGKAFVGAQATLENLRANASGADVIHLACHAQFRSDNPMFSALHLHDGALTVELAEALSLRAGIVVLSACETGLAEAGNGNESVGLVRAFLVAGAARVLASQWPVDDAVTAVFMAGFYAALCRGLTAAQALRLAQAEVRREHPHPFYWAAFTLHGGW